jgi:hypothetical protein
VCPGLAEEICLGKLPQQLDLKISLLSLQELKEKLTLTTFKNKAIQKLRSFRKFFKPSTTNKPDTEYLLIQRKNKAI